MSSNLEDQKEELMAVESILSCGQEDGEELEFQFEEILPQSDDIISPSEAAAQSAKFFHKGRIAIAVSLDNSLVVVRTAQKCKVV